LKKRVFFPLFCGVMALMLVFGFFIKTESVYAAAPDYTDPNSPEGVRIKNWTILQDMTIFGRNINNGCGPTAMAILLQFYNDLDTCHKGKYLPDALDYKSKDAPGAQSRADALRDDVNSRTTKILWGAFGNATRPINQRDGLNSFLDTYCAGLGVSAISGEATPYGHVETMVRNKIDNDIPVVLTMLNYNVATLDGEQYDTGMFLNGEAHTVVAYGYRGAWGNTEYLCHSGWVNSTDNDDNIIISKTDMWFSALNGFLYEFEYGYVYLDASVTPHQYIHNYSTHKHICTTCGYTLYDYAYINKTSVYHTFKCNLCGYTRQEAHSFITTYSNGKVVTMCQVCGYSIKSGPLPITLKKGGGSPLTFEQISAYK